MKTRMCKLEEFENDVMKIIYLGDKETMGRVYCEAHIVWKTQNNERNIIDTKV